MCRFDNDVFILNYDALTISIHLMCRFDPRYSILAKSVYLDFNTSHVSVRLNKTKDAIFNVKFQYISCVGSILLDDMNLKYHPIFQYISCVGSIINGLGSVLFPI